MSRFYTIFALGWACLGLLLTWQPAYAQNMPPRNAPLILLNTVQQDGIWLYDLTMNAPSRLDLGTGTQFAWGFSPDGCHILATRDNQLVQVDLNGQNLRELINAEFINAESINATDWGVFEPTWSPDGSKIAFTLILYRTNQTGETVRETAIAWIPAEGGTPTLYDNSENAYSPQWSPDGTSLVFSRYEQRVAGADIFATAIPTNPPPQGTTPDTPTLLNEADLWITSADGATSYALTDFPTGNVTIPRWSPDGTLISFVYSPSANNDMFWMIANQEGAIPTQLSYEWVTILDTTWLPDGTAIIGSVMGLQNIAQNRLWRVPLVGRADSDATLYLNNPNFSHEDYPRFSPDGRYLATRTSYALAIVDLTNNTQTVLNESWAQGNTPVMWSPKGFGGEQNCP